MKKSGAAPLAVLLAVIAAAASGQPPDRLIDDVNVSERSDHVDISLLFGCTLQYRGVAGEAPAELIRIRFAPGRDCGDLSTALTQTLPLADAAKYLRALEWDHLAGTELTLTVRLAGKQNFLLAPAADGHGLRLRLLQPQAQRGRIIVGDSLTPAANYAVNLDSSRDPFDDDAVARAASALGVAAYVSSYELAGPIEAETWYRLRAGPFATRADAEQVLRAARAAYPKAWLAIGDETLLAGGGIAAAPDIAATTPAGTATLSGGQITELLDQAHRSFTGKDYATAIPLLTRLLEQPEFPQRAEVQELMGLARERNRQLAHAKAEYEEYLRRYPDGPAAKRVRERLRALALATRAPGVSASAFGTDEDSWKVYGGVSQHYRRDTSALDNDVVRTDVVSQNAVFNDLDTIARRHGERFDFTARLDADYIKDLLADGPGDRTRVTSLFVDLADHELDWAARLGRQTQNTGGLFGTFDGLSGAWQLRPLVRLKVAAGLPVELASDGPDTGRRFLALASEFGTFGSGWDLSFHALAQQLDHLTDREVVGTELRYFQPERSLVLLTDYDLRFGTLNSTFLLGTMRLPGRWTLSANIDRRKSPLLSLRNALIGQPADSFDTLTGSYTPQELQQLARDRSADSSLYDLAIARPFGERWQWSLDVALFALGATPASGGVPATPASGTDTAITLQGMAFALFGGGDLSAITLRHQNGASQDVDSAGFSTRFPLWGRLRLGPSLRVDHRLLHGDDSRQWLYVPGLRLELQQARFLLDLESGAELGRRQLANGREDSTRYYFSLGYRMNF